MDKQHIRNEIKRTAEENGGYAIFLPYTWLFKPVFNAIPVPVAKRFAYKLSVMAVKEVTGETAAFRLTSDPGAF